jgi:hypothetical protein
MTMSRPLLAAGIAIATIAWSGIAAARPVKILGFEDLWAAATVVAIGTVQSSADDPSWEPHEGDRFVPVRTVFRLEHILKGDVTDSTLVLEHHRPTGSALTEIDGPDYVEFDASKAPRYLMFLRPTSTGGYEPASPEPSNAFMRLWPSVEMSQ